MNAQKLVNQIIYNKNSTPIKKGYGQASINIALSKYWGKRDTELNLPTNSSLSISLPNLGTKTSIEAISKPSDQIYLNGKLLANTEIFAKRLSKFLDYFRQTKNKQNYFKVDTTNTVPTAAGLASSASGYAALVLALNDYYQWQLNKKQLSILARLGSGSATRSIYNGFVIWHKGVQEDGLDSYAEELDISWQELRIGLIEIDVSEKKTSSSEGMKNTVATCELYQAWPAKAEKDLQIIKQSIIEKDFPKLGRTAESNALSMHATMIATIPPILYWQAESVTTMHKIWHLRELGTEVYFTMDAGPNLKLLFLEGDTEIIKHNFKNIKVIKPF